MIVVLVEMVRFQHHREHWYVGGIAAEAANHYGVGGGLIAGMIVGLTTLVGFDSAANLADEAKDPFRSVPRAIVTSAVAAGVLGLLFLIGLTVAIKDIPAVSTEGSPVAAIIRGHLGPVAGLARTEINTFCYRLLHVVARITRGARQPRRTPPALGKPAPPGDTGPVQHALTRSNRPTHPSRRRTSPTPAPTKNRG